MAHESAPPTEVAQPAFAALPAPLAYFGQPALTRVTKPIGFTSMENGSVVLIIVDALNAKHLGVYGYNRDTSPNLDTLAAEGLLLSNYVSNSSWTRPSFTTLITGLPKREHGIEWNGNDLDRKIVTLAERFRKAGYRTAGIVGNQLVQSIWGFDQGFQTYEDVKTLDQIFPRDGVLVDKAIDWISKSGDKPFFLMLFLIDPHTPYRPLRADRHFLDALPEGKVIRFPHREYKKPLPKGDHQRMVAAYDGEVHSADRQIARLMAFLKETNKMTTTSVAITADHGEAFGHHNCYTHTYHMWEPVLRVPFILVSPAVEAKGIYDDRPFTHVDMAPTLLDLAGIDYSPDELSGTSIVKALTDPAAHRERILFSQYNAHGVRRQAVRNGRWKLIHHHKVKDSALVKLKKLQIPKRQPDPRTLPTLAWDGERYEFYDLDRDPGEMNDLFSSRQNTPALLELSHALQSQLGNMQSKGKITEEMMQALENIGYIER
jgi:arylsulfatase A-like enzyme